MARNQNTYRMLMNTLIVVLLWSEILHKGACLVIKKQDSITEDTSWNQNQNLHQYYSSKFNGTNIDAIEDDDPNYPYDQLLQLVKNTKRIIRSSNETEKNQLNLDSSLYTGYLLGELSDSALYAGIPYPSTTNTCPEKRLYREPRRLIGEDNKKYYIINVGKELKQRYFATICSDSGSRCDSAGFSSGYSFFCETSLNRKRSFISVPVGNEISLSQQRLRTFYVPDSCICSWIRNKE